MANEKFARQTFIPKIAAGIVVSYVNTITHFSITLSGKFNLKEKLFRKEKKKSCAQRKRERDHGIKVTCYTSKTERFLSQTVNMFK